MQIKVYIKIYPFSFGLCVYIPFSEGHMTHSTTETNVSMSVVTLDFLLIFTSSCTCTFAFNNV